MNSTAPVTVSRPGPIMFTLDTSYKKNSIFAEVLAITLVVNISVTLIQYCSGFIYYQHNISNMLGKEIKGPVTKMAESRVVLIWVTL